MPAVTIYHNPRCSKSRQTLALLEEHGITPNVVLYLDNPPDEKTLKSLIAKLKLSGAHDLLRVKEAAYREQGLSPGSSDNAIIQAMIKAPKLIERPIVVSGQKAVLGRPPENVLALIKSA